ncbi:hypothetical protein A4G18_05560 [Pasteurellaceae bacterium Pebbles2]|nr:hypothetical protein [Pasteurellaceae bacterium Pebbles2]
MKRKTLWLALLALPLFGQAAEPLNTPQNTVRFSVEAEREAQFDVLQVKLFVQEEQADLEALHKTISEKLNRALAKIKAQSAVAIKSNDRATNANYNEKGKKIGWVERADFVLESKDFYALSQLVDALSDVLSIEYIQPILSADAVAKLEDELSKDVLNKFQHKAELIKTHLKSKDYKIISLDLPTLNQSDYGIRNRMVFAAAPMAAKMETAPVEIESGKTNVKARVDAAIELIEN